MADKNMEAQISVEFEEATSRQSLNSGETINTLWGKVKRWLTDLKTVCFSGSYNDLSDTPTIATTDTDGLMSTSDKVKLDDADNTYALKSKYGDTTIDVGRKSGATVGSYSTAEGYNTTASGYASHAEGRNTTASSFCSHAGGYNTTASHNHEVAYGRYNKSNNNTLFSIGDGTADDARHNAFEITVTGGKLHDKDIATTDIIPDLTPYAKTTDVSGIKVNEAVNADTVGGFRANQFVLGAAVVQLKMELNEYYTAGTVSVEEQYTPNFPVGYGSFGLLDVRVYGSIVYQTIRFENGKIIHRARVLGATDWTEWAEIYTSGNKPYVTGSATVAANSTICITNHGFKPSAVIYWYGIEGGVAVSSNETQFMLSGVSQNADRLVNYLIFK